MIRPFEPVEILGLFKKDIESSQQTNVCGTMSWKAAVPQI